MVQQAESPTKPALPLAKRVIFSILKFVFKLLYHQFAWSYDWVAALVSAGAWQDWIKTTLPFVTGARILEIGFGPGHLQSRLVQDRKLTIGLDESPQMIRLARQRLSKLSLKSNLVRAHAQNLPLASNTLDQVVITFPAEFILTSSTFTEIHRVLIHNGSVIIVPGAWITGKKPLERLLAWVNKITGEAPILDESYLDNLKIGGFDLSWKLIDLSSSRVLLVILTKTPMP